MKSLTKFLAIAISLLPTAAFSQQNPDKAPAEKHGISGLFDNMNRHDVFNTIEIAGNIGTTGLGLEIASPMTQWAKLRVGFDCMPHFTIPMTFGIESYVDGHINDKFDKIQSLMEEISGMTIDKDIKMESKPTMTTLRVLVDVYPFKNNRHWHFTTGFFYGGNTVGKSINTVYEMPSLLAINMYNRAHNLMTLPFDEFMDRVVNEPIIGDVYLDPESAAEIYDNLNPYFAEYGRLGVHVGDHKDGTPYMMEPDKDGTVSATAIVNRFRPYVGFGYGGALTKDGKWQVSFDAGVQFWGGMPKVTTHDGTVLNDLDNLRGKVGDYMNLMKIITVYPTIDFRLSYRF